MTRPGTPSATTPTTQDPGTPSPPTPATPTPATEDMVRELWDRQQIGDVMLRFGRGLDLHDWEM